MRFYDINEYTHYLQNTLLSSSSIIYALAFHPTQPYLITGSTNGFLKLYYLPQLASDACTPDSIPCSLITCDHSNYGSINALLVTQHHIYVATDKALLSTSWKTLLHRAPITTVVLNHCHITSLALIANSTLIAARANAAFVSIADTTTPSQPVSSILSGTTSSPQCIATSPTDPNIFLAGFDDGVVRHYDIRASTPLINQTVLPPSSTDTNIRITALCINNDASFAMVADSSYRLTTIHIATATILSSVETPFLPQALSFSDGLFYCAGSDTKGAQQKSLLAFDLNCKQKACSPLASSAVYAIASSPTGMIAAGGYSPQRHASTSSLEFVDVFCVPPVRSFSFSVYT